MIFPPQLLTQGGRDNVSRVFADQYQLWNAFKSLDAVIVFPVSFQLQRSLIRAISVHPIGICEVFVSFRYKRVKIQIYFHIELLTDLCLGIIDESISFPQSLFDIFLLCFYSWLIRNNFEYFDSLRRVATPKLIFCDWDSLVWFFKYLFIGYPLYPCSWSLTCTNIQFLRAMWMNLSRADQTLHPFVNLSELSHANMTFL